MTNLARSPVLVAMAVTLATLLLLLLRDEVLTQPPRELPVMFAESREYTEMAQGQARLVESPFTKRALNPFLARVLSRLTGVPVRGAFIVLALFSFAFLALYLGEILRVLGLPPWPAALFLLTPYPLDELELGYMPDLLDSALLALFFLLLLRKKTAPALLVLALSFTARESTVVLCGLLLVLGWLRRDRLVAAGAGLVTLFGVAFGAWCVRGGRPNIHHIPDAVYLALKLPFNFSKNILGLVFWTNTFTDTTAAVKWTLPHALGAIRQVGLSAVDVRYPLFTLITWLCLFGAAPLLLHLVRRARPFSGAHSLAVQLAAIYGAFSFLLGPCLGDSIDRLIGYGWPLFWIALPALMAPLGREPGRRTLRLAFVTIPLVAWLPLLLGASREAPVPWDLFVLLLVAAAYAAVWYLLGGRFATLKNP